MAEKNGKTKNRGGRPPFTFSEEQLSQIEALAAFLNMEQIADYFGTTRQTLNEVMKRQPEVSLRYKKGKSRAITSVAKSLIDEARGGNVTAQIFYLKTQGGWKETQVTEHSGEVISKHLDLSDERYKELAKKALAEY